MVSTDQTTAISQQASALHSRRTLYVGGLAENVKDKTLHAAFITFGPLKSVELPMDYVSGSHKGFGFVEFEDPDDAAEAIYNMDGAEIMGRALTVNLAQPSHQQTSSNRAVWANDEWFQDRALTRTGEAKKNDSAQEGKEALTIK